MKDKIYILLDQAVQSSTNFMLTLLFVKILSVEDFKLYIIASSFVLMLQPFFSTVVNSIIIKNKVKEFTLKLEAFFFAVAFFSLFLLVFRDSRLIIVSYILVMAFTEYLRLIFIMNKEYVKLINYDIIVSASKYLLVFLLNVFALGISEYFVYLTLIFIFIFMFFKNININIIHSELKLFFNQWHIFFKTYNSLLIQSIPIIVLGQLTVPLAAYFLSAEKIQIYSVILSFTGLVFLVFQAFNKYFLVEFSNIKTSSNKNKYLIKIFKYLIFIVPLILFIICNSKYIISFLYNDLIAQYSFIFSIILVINFFVLFSQIVTILLTTTPFINYLNRITYVQITLFIIFFIPLIYFYGLMGLIIYYILSRIVQLIIIITIYKMYLEKGIIYDT